MKLKPAPFAVLNGHPLGKNLHFSALLNEGTGTKVYDASGNKWEGSQDKDTIVWNGGIDGHSLLFDPTDTDWITFGDAPAMGGTFPIGMLDFSVSVLVRPDAVSGGDPRFIIAQYGPDGADYYATWILMQLDQTFSFQVIGDHSDGGHLQWPPGFIGLITGNIITAGNWYHIVVVRKGAEGFIYVNGVEEANETGTFDSDNANIRPDKNIALGAEIRTPRWYFEGLISNAMIWKDRALSAENAIQLYYDPYAMFRPVISQRIFDVPTIDLLNFERASFRGANRGVMRGVG